MFILYSVNSITKRHVFTRTRRKLENQTPPVTAENSLHELMSGCWKTNVGHHLLNIWTSSFFPELAFKKSRTVWTFIAVRMLIDTLTGAGLEPSSVYGFADIRLLLPDAGGTLTRGLRSADVYAASQRPCRTDGWLFSRLLPWCTCDLITACLDFWTVSLKTHAVFCLRDLVSLFILTDLWYDNN